jgi:hypothetical protein
LLLFNVRQAKLKRFEMILSQGVPKLGMIFIHFLNQNMKLSFGGAFRKYLSSKSMKKAKKIPHAKICAWGLSEK